MDVTRLHTMATKYLTDTCSVARRDSTSDGAGGTTAAWVTVATGVLCNVQPNPRLALTNEVASGTQNTARWRLYVDIGTDIRARDRITMANGDVFEVVGDNAARTDEVLIDYDLVTID